MLLPETIFFLFYHGEDFFFFSRSSTDLCVHCVHVFFVEGVLKTWKIGYLTSMLARTDIMKISLY